MKQNLATGVVTQSKTVELVQMALMIAIICVSTMVIHIPTIGMGYVHPGDSMVLFAAILFGKRKGTISAGIGMGLADILLGYAYYAPFTFIIKGLMAFVAATIAYRGDYEGKNILNNIFASLVGGAVMVIGYFVAGIIVTKFVLLKVDSISEAITISLAGITGNVMQAVVGVIIAVPLIKLLKGKLKINNN